MVCDPISRTLGSRRRGHELKLQLRQLELGRQEEEKGEEAQEAHQEGGEEGEETLEEGEEEGEEREEGAMRFF